MKRNHIFLVLILCTILPGTVFTQVPEGWNIQQIDDHGPYEDMAGRDLDLRLDQNNIPHIFYRDQYYYPMYATWTGAEWVIEKVSIPGIPPTVKFYSFSMDLDNEGQPHIFFVAPVPNAQGFYSQRNESGWTPAEVADPGAKGWVSHMRLDSDDVPHVVFYGYNTACYTTRTDGGWEKHRFYGYSSGRNNAIALDSNGRPHVACDGKDGNLYYYYLTETGWKDHIIDFMGYYAGTNNIALTVDSQDVVHIVYIYRDTPEIRYARGNGDTWDIQTGLDILDVGSYFLPSMALDPDGNPHISYTYLYSHLNPADWEARYLYWDGNVWTKEIMGHCDYTSILADGSGNIHLGILNMGFPNNHIQSWPGEEGLWYAVKENSIEAMIDLNPETLNLKSEGKWITCMIELPEEFDAAEIDPAAVCLAKIGEFDVDFFAEDKPQSWGDKNENGIPDLTVKFDRATVIETIKNNELTGLVEMTVTGRTNQIRFEGSDCLRILDNGLKKAFSLNPDHDNQEHSFVFSNYPNPFNPATTISYTIEESQHLSIDIYNIQGRKIKTLFRGGKAAGEYQVIWNGKDDLENPVSGGLYLCRFQMRNFSKTIRILFVD